MWYFYDMIHSMNVHELAVVFSDSRDILQNKLAEQEELLQSRENELTKKEGRYIQKGGDPDLAGLYAELAVFFSHPKYIVSQGQAVELEKIVERNRKILYHIELQKTPRTKRKVNFERDLAKARSIPISSIIEFDRTGFAECVFHNEKTASMKYYEKNNRVKCFGCGKYADAIEIIQRMYNYNFKQAVDHLASL